MYDAKNAMHTASEKLRCAMNDSYQASCAAVDASRAQKGCPSSPELAARSTVATRWLETSEHIRFHAGQDHYDAVSAFRSALDRDLLTSPALDHRSNDYQLLICVRAGDIRGFQKLLDHGANIHAHDEYHNSALGLAASAGRSEMCSLLLRKKMSLSHVNIYGRAPLHLAARAGHSEICTLLTDHGAVIDQLDCLGTSPLYSAAACDNQAVCIALIERGANVNAPSKFGERPLDAAVSRGHTDLCTALIQNGTHVNPIHTWDRSLLAIAAERRFANTCLALIAYGADPKGIVGSNIALRKVLGMTQLRAAVKWGDGKVLLTAIESDSDEETIVARIQREISGAKTKLPEMAAIMRSWLAKRAADDAIASCSDELGIDLADAV